jgi:nitrite reductase/ring-hydroxylating ferredoxin subunit
MDSPSPEFQEAASEQELSQNRMMVVELSGRKIALIYSNFKAYAIDNACTHLGGSLGTGTLKGQTVVCPLHHWSYNFTSGRIVDGISDEKVKTYETKIENGKVFIRI